MHNEITSSEFHTDFGTTPTLDDQSAKSPTVAADYQPRTVLGKLGQSAFAQKVALITATFIGGGALSGLPGCSTRENGAGVGFKDSMQANRSLEKEAKFSTLPNDAKVALEQMNSLLTERAPLEPKIETAIAVVVNFVGEFEKTHSTTSGALTSFQSSLNEIKQAMTTAQNIKSFAPSLGKITEIREAITTVQTLTPEDFAAGTSSLGYTQVVKVQSDLHECRNALERDREILQKGVQANSIADLIQSIEGSTNQLSVMIAQPNISEWLDAHVNDRALVKAQLEHSIDKLATAETNASFVQILFELQDSGNLLKDVLKLVAPEQRTAVTANDFTADPDIQKAVVKGALQLLQALSTDLTKELTLTIGAESLAANNGSPATQASAPASASTTDQPAAHHYHHSGGGFWYMPINTGSGYHGSYSYSPYQSYSYSGSERLRASPEYQSFSSTSNETHQTAAGKSGLLSHESGPLGRTSTAISGSNSHFSPSPSSHVGSSSSGNHSVGGFSSGRSYSSGLGG